MFRHSQNGNLCSFFNWCVMDSPPAYNPAVFEETPPAYVMDEEKSASINLGKSDVPAYEEQRSPPQQSQSHGHAPTIV